MCPSPQDSITRIKDAHRTCDLILGVGDGNEKTFRGFEYSASVATVVTDTTLIPVNNTWHPEIENVVYWGMDWLCPAYNLVREPEGRYSDSRLLSLNPTLYLYQVLSEQLRKWHGNITVANTVRDIVSIVQTGNLHAAVYDLTTQVLNNNTLAVVLPLGVLSPHLLLCCRPSTPSGNVRVLLQKVYRHQPWARVLVRPRIHHAAARHAVCRACASVKWRYRV